MNTTPQVPWRNALVIGLGASGLAAADLLLALGCAVRGYDQRPSIAGPPPGLQLLLGQTSPEKAAFEGIDLLVLSPGVPPKMFLELCRTHAPQAQIHGELGLAWTVCQSAAPSTILITGTNGKSTVTALVGELLAAAGRKPFVGGNLGTPLSTAAADAVRGTADWPTELVLECSSYQLETLPVLPTAAAAILNITPDHLDRYPSMEAYAKTKGRVFGGLGPEGLALLGAEDPWTPTLTPNGPKVGLVGPNGLASLRQPDGSLAVGDLLFDRHLLRLPGRHNAINALFALAIATHVGCDAETCVRGLSQFAGLPHRMVRVRELDGVVYYNDSKATNVASALASLGGLDQPFVLIAGGRAKGDDLEPLGALLRDRARGLVTIGEAAPQFLALAGSSLPATSADNMEQAVASARALAAPGDAVVLAPACASFDQYRSYADRGDAFESAVAALSA